MARPGSASSWATATAPFRPTEKQALQDVLNAAGPAVVADLNGDGIPDISGQGRRHVRYAVLHRSGAQSRRHSGGESAQAARFGGAAGPGGAGTFRAGSWC